ncbi:hypothetical protein D9Q98_009854 [Chlorella vulgaris]|uniref:Sec-independent translocase n=1 Tax=Chlorella vulgaris TaxID=3077 RepID=A0A9D4YSP6_CHLVU|nr:hypothetical protein D9Q98_009854 [Chlorella vulgaris]
MFSIGQVFVIVVAAAWAFGPNELPRVARVAGRLTGQATGFLYRTRARFFQFAEDTEMTKLHQEVQATMYQLHAIRSELQGGMNIFNPGPIAQRAMSLRPMPDQAGGASSFQAGQPQQQQQPLSMPPRPPLASSWAASAVQMQTAEPATQQQQQQPQQQPQRQHLDQGAEGQQHPLTLPVSAVAAGWAPNRAGTVPSGSEILLDALAEELVAAQMLQMQQQQQAAAAAAAAAAASAALRHQQQAAAVLAAAQQQQAAGGQQQGDSASKPDPFAAKGGD